MKRALTFDDILINPEYSDVLPSEVDISGLFGRVGQSESFRYDIPILSAAMDTVTGEEMAFAMSENGGAGVIHRNMRIEEQAKIVRNLKERGTKRIVAAVGSTDDGRAEELVKAGVHVICIDAAHGWTKAVMEAVRRVVKLGVPVWGGNVASGRAAVELVQAGCDAVKVGIGAGSICTTRIVTGVGVPQAQAIIEVSTELRRVGTLAGVIADGGMRNSGDVAKALALGADMVMLGNMLAGTNESLSESKYGLSTYRGMGSKEAMTSNSADRYMSSGKKTAEGVSASVFTKGTVKETLEEICGGVRSAMGYTGCKDLWEFKKRVFWEMTGNGIKESGVHSVVATSK